MAVLGCTWGHVFCVILLVCSAFLNLNCVQNAKILQESSFQSEAVRIYLQRQGYIIMSSIFQWTNIRRQKYGCRQKRRILLEYGCKKHPHLTVDILFYEIFYWCRRILGHPFLLVVINFCFCNHFVTEFFIASFIIAMTNSNWCLLWGCFNTDNCNVLWPQTKNILWSEVFLYPFNPPT